jgi:hypothetical protein
MPIYIEISRLHGSVTIVARGKISPDEIRGAAQQMFDARVPEFAKLVDVSAASTDVNQQQVESIAELLRSGSPGQKRGPIAFLIDPTRGEFARAFKATQGERPVSLFKSLHEARDWLARGGAPSPAEPDRAEGQAEQTHGTPWSDPKRQAVLFRGDRRRDVAIKADPNSPDARHKTA